MKHLGDITKINGHNVPLVDVVIGGSPCQDLSVAGQRKGLQHSALGDGETTRSGLFMEQIRIIEEMRDESTKQLSMRGADVDRGSIRPRYMVWENVPGALSSGIPKGGDFRCVLEETCRIADKAATVPMPEKGKWSNSGCIVGDGWSVAWRVHDAQFWGVPQRRKRISLVADFGGESAPEILFERKSLRGNLEESREKKQDSSRPSEADSCETISFQGGGEESYVMREAVCIGNGQLHDALSPSVEVAKTINCMCDPMKVITYGLDRASFNQGQNAKYDFSIQEDLAQTLVSKGPGGY